MTDDVVVLGSGYAGTGAVKQLESVLDNEADITWVSEIGRASCRERVCLYV